MAITTLTAAEHIVDPVTFEEAALQFQMTRQPEFDLSVKALVRKLQRWAKNDGLATEASARGLVVSYSDLLVAHARRHPA